MQLKCNYNIDFTDFLQVKCKQQYVYLLFTSIKSTLVMPIFFLYVKWFHFYHICLIFIKISTTVFSFFVN